MILSFFIHGGACGGDEDDDYLPEPIYSMEETRWIIWCMRGVHEFLLTSKIPSGRRKKTGQHQSMMALEVTILIGNSRQGRGKF